jgi:transcriptional regulator with PAS, ATPase and Fis domain
VGAQGDDETATRVASERAGSLRLRAARLEVTAGPDAGRHVLVDRPTFLIGTGGGADLRLTDVTVSREHLRLTLLAQGVHLRDEGSKNGTFVGAVRVADAVLGADAVLELGTTRVALRLEAAPIDLPLSASTSFGDAIGVSASMRHLFAILERAALSDVSVLIEGESGVGKELLARAIHTRSARAHGPFIALDCGAIPAGLVESELFGHERGAFTGATQSRPGVFALADGGTLLLDEIGQLALDLQPKLLRALEQREVRALGARAPRRVDVRVVAATNRRLAEAAHNDEFRRDLFYRLAVARVTVPPLRDRPEDVEPLARAFLRAATRDPNAEVPADFVAMLRSYAWPGNARELRNVVERWALLGLRDPRGLFDLSPPRTVASPTDRSHLTYHEARRAALDELDRAYLPKVLERAGGVVARAAEIAGVARPSFHRMLERIRRGTGDDRA